MGALSSFSLWTPEDDLLLKNAVEAGASLESLAKGAVEFSRKYSIAEIRDRWYSMLYDPIVSSEASAYMVEYELSTLPLPPKFYKFGLLKEQKVVSVKRKAASVRNAYYAMRKRIRKDMLTSMDYNFLVDPENENFVVNGNETLPENGMPEGPTLNHFSSLDPPHYDLPENTMDVEAATNGLTAQAFYNGVDDTLEGNFPIDHSNILEEEPQNFDDNLSLNEAAEELGVPAELDIDKFIGDDGLDEMSLSAFQEINNDPANLCSDFDEDFMFDSPELECGTSFDNIQLSLLPDMPPVWNTKEPDIPCDGSKDSIACGEDYLEELSNELLNFTGEEEQYLMDAAGKDGIDKSYYDGLSSLLLNSPIEVCPEQTPEIAEADLLLTAHTDIKNLGVSSCSEVVDNAGKAETELLVASNAYVNDRSVSCRAEVDDNAVSQSNGVLVVPKLESQMSTSASARDPQFPELSNGVIFCKLNTEDPEVPSNDDVFLPFPAFSCSSESPSRKSNTPVSSSVNDYGYRASKRGKVLVQVEQNNSIGASVPSQTTGAGGLSGPVCGYKIKRELSNNHASHTLSRSAVIASGCIGGNNNETNTTHAPLHANPKEKLVNDSFVKNLSNNVTNFPHEKPAIGNGFGNNVQPCSLRPEQDVALPFEDNRLQRAEMGSSDVLESELVVNPQALDEEGQYIESDDDVPYYSDVEALVLDMDLDPDDPDFYDNEEVSRFQHEETKRAIMRLEQGSHSCMQRAMASHGALALLYGRHSKHFIKKTEVLLGRATEGFDVDIDLGKGGCGNTISRRQAIIRMDKDGSFFIKNLGKSSIMVNNKELGAGKSQRLHSNYLIELKGTQFIFETNQSSVKR